MQRQIENSLVSLVPSLHPLPADLLNLANALLAQSKTVARDVGKVEEVGRAYACAQIACERLKIRLSLPPFDPRPPLQPRIYNRLYAYLSDRLAPVPSAPSTPKTPSRHADKLTTPASRKRAAASPTPAASAAATPSRRAEKRPRPAPQPTSAELPAWVDILAGRVCAALGAVGDAAAAHVGAGARHVVPAHRTPDAVGVAGLVVVLALLVVARQGGREVPTGEFVARRASGVRAVLEFGRDEGLEMAVSEEGVLAAVEELLGASREEAWLEGEWFASVARRGEWGQRGQGKLDKTPLRRREKLAPRPGVPGDGEEECPAGLRTGLATMFQDSVDWLAPWRRGEYEVWHERIMDMIEKAETGNKSGGTQKGSGGRRLSREVATS